MKEFRTEVRVSPAGALMELKDSIVTQGSCFTDAMGNRLKEHKLRTLVNPFGVIYNPESIHRALEYGVFNEPMPEHTYLKHNEVYLNYNTHSVFSALKKEDLVTRLTETIGTVHYFLKDAGWLLLTYGTAWIYTRNDTGEIVANCHKLPGSVFTKSLMDVEAVISSFTRFYARVKELNPGVRIILTVSPVRHLKDTLEMNAVSKGVLRLASHHISERFRDVEYFPVFEMMIDDLRDYRFYRSDMLHPTTDAEDYIWEKFKERYFSPALHEFVRSWKAVLSALRHRPFHPTTTAHQQFLMDTLGRLKQLESLVDVSEEITLIRNQIVKE